MTSRNRNRRGNSQKKRLLKKQTREQRSASRQIATPAIHTVSRIVELLKPWELSNTQRFRTYQLMLQDEAVWSGVESRITSIEIAQSNFKLKYDKNSERSVFLKNFIEYNLRNMKRSNRAIGREMGEMVYNGISLHEVVASPETRNSEYMGMFTLDDLLYIDPLTLDPVQPLSTKNNGREIAVWRQRQAAFVDGTFSSNFLRVDNSIIRSGVNDIDSRKVGVASYNASQGRPMGTSVFDAAYTPWREKNLIQDFLLMGVQKDLAGTPVLRVPLDLFEKGKDLNSDAGRTMTQLQQHMANLHAGDQTYMILPSNTFSENGSGVTQYGVEFQGVQGSGKNFDLVAIIEQKKKAIFNVLASQHLLTGENGGGSYNLLEGQASVQAHYSKRDNMICDDVYNKTIIPMLLRLNDFSDEVFSDIPVYCHGDVQPLSADEVTKGLQRTGAVGLLPKYDPRFLNEAYEKMGYEYRFDEDIDREELKSLLSEETSRSGDGMSQGMASGTGDSTGNNSAVNSENAA